MHTRMVNWLLDGNTLMEKPVKDNRIGKESRSRTEKIHQDDEEQQVGMEATITMDIVRPGCF